jgi:small subunit ribosomal protein S2
MNITVRDLLDAGVHFGHQLRRWNPRSKPYVFDQRHGISIIDLEKTYACLEKATEFIQELVASGGDVLLVGTKKQAQELIREAAAATGMPFCSNRWMGGGLTNFSTIKRSIEKYKRYMAMENDGSMAKLPKKEAAAIKREMARMNRNLEGMLEMRDLPRAVFLIDVKTEAIAVEETRRLNIPLVALVDTNSDPSLVTYPIPGNDDAVKSVRIIVETIVEAIQNGLAQRESRRAAKGVAAAAQKEIYAEQQRQAAAAKISDAEDLAGVKSSKLVSFNPDDAEAVVAPKKKGKKPIDEILDDTAE